MESITFERLLQQAERMAQDYADLKEKYIQVKHRYRELCIKYENELKEIAVLFFNVIFRYKRKKKYGN